jgi:hypothetical protein
MSAHESKRKRRPQNHPAEQGFYVYAIAERDALSQLFADALPAAIEPEAALEMLAQDDLAAVVSPVPLERYGEDALQEQLADATWTAIRAMRHEKVVEHFARRMSIIPLRFGIIYLERERLKEMLSQKQEELRAIIKRLRGREEWGVNIYYDRAKLLEKITELSPRLRELAESADSASPGQSYLLRKKIDGLREAEARAETKRVAARVEEELSSRSEGAARLRVLKDEATEVGELAARLAFLVERERFDEFRAAAEQLAKEYEDAGFKLELTGPWPAYNFAAN